MSASLVGSEMCIRDRLKTHRMLRADQRINEHLAERLRGNVEGQSAGPGPCLLYTSDAADDM
eukprot:2607815-Alexandrium_andersonii.AAC.1